MEVDDIHRFTEEFGSLGCPEIDFRLHGLSFIPKTMAVSFVSLVLKGR